MGDLGDLEIVRKPLIISEAKVGGRKLTKSLWAQMPEYDKGDQYPLPENGVSFRAWVNHHWKECEYSEFVGIGHEHRHVLVEYQGNVCKSTVWSPVRPGHTVEVNYHSPAWYALVALTARKMLAGEKVAVTTDWTINGQRVGALATYGQTVKEIPTYYSGDETGKAELARVAQFDKSHDEIIDAVQADIDQEREWREKVAGVWDLVTTETPQVYL